MISLASPLLPLSGYGTRAGAKWDRIGKPEAPGNRLSFYIR